MVHAAHEVALLVDEGVERTVGERHLVAVRSGFVALLVEHGQGGIDEAPAAGPGARRGSCPLAELASLLAGDAGQ